MKRVIVTGAVLLAVALAFAWLCDFVSDMHAIFARVH